MNQKWTTQDIPDLSGKVAIVTGANSGIGFETAKALAQKGATVIMACRNLDKANAAVTEIKKAVRDAKLDIIQLDLADLASVRSFAEAFLGKYDTLDLLINNAGVMIPPFTIAIPLYIVATQIRMVNTLWGVIIPFSISNFGIFLMRQYCLGVPQDLISAARIDGASEFTILLRIVFPVVATGCTALGILKFLLTWNDLFWPLIMLTDDARKTLTVMLATFIDFERFVDYGLLMAMTTLVVLPVILLFVVFQRRIIEGVALTGMKG